MATDALTVDVTSSYGQRSDGDLRVVLLLPGTAAPEAPTVLRLRSGKRIVRVPTEPRATSEGLLLDVRIPEDQVPSAVWKLALLTGPDNTTVPLEARLLTSRKQPVALLAGPAPKTSMAAPAPASPATSTGIKPHVRHAAVRTVDRVLSVLPEARARRYRAALGKAGRRVLH